MHMAEHQALHGGAVQQGLQELVRLLQGNGIERWTADGQGRVMQDHKGGLRERLQLLEHPLPLAL
jgi:hypothetical protein